MSTKPPVVAILSSNDDLDQVVAAVKDASKMRPI